MAFAEVNISPQKLHKKKITWRLGTPTEYKYSPLPLGSVTKPSLLFFIYKIGLKRGVFSRPGYTSYLNNRDPCFRGAPVKKKTPCILRHMLFIKKQIR